MASLNLRLCCDIKKELAKFDGGSGKFVFLTKIRNQEQKIFPINFKGEMCTAGISATEFATGKSKKTCYSVGINVPESSQLQAIIQQMAWLAKEEAIKIWGEEEMDYVETIKDDDKIFIKLKTDAQFKNFNFKTNLPINPKKYSDTNGCDEITFDGEASVWFNFEDKRYGLTFIPKRLTFHTEE